MGTSSRSWTRRIWFLNFSIRSKVARAVMEYTNRKPSPSLLSSERAQCSQSVSKTSEGRKGNVLTDRIHCTSTRKLSVSVCPRSIMDRSHRLDPTFESSQSVNTRLANTRRNHELTRKAVYSSFDRNRRCIAREDQLSWLHCMVSMGPAVP